MDECADEHRDRFPQRLICYKTMDLAAADRQYAALHEDAPWHDGTFTSWVEERDAGHPYHYSDGVRIWVSDVDYSPGDDFLSR